MADPRLDRPVFSSLKVEIDGLTLLYKNRTPRTPNRYVGPAGVVGQWSCFNSTSHNMFIGICNRVLIIKNPGFDYDQLIGKYHYLPQDLIRSLSDKPMYNGQDKPFIHSKFLQPVWFGNLQSVGRRLASVVKVRKITPEEFVESRPKGKYQLYTQALQELLDQRKLCPKDVHVNIFIKWELVASSDKDPRIISPRSPKYNILLGQYINKNNELAVYKGIDTLWGEETVFKHCTLPAMAAQIVRKWHSFSCPVAVGLDASRFDQHVSRQALNFEHSVYRFLFPGDSELNTLLRCQIVNYCKGKGDIFDFEYKATGRMSGDMNTSVGNVILMTSVLLHWREILGLNFKLVNNGDDSVAIMDVSELPRFLDGFDLFFVAYGFNMVAEEPVYHVEHIEFCQMKPVQLDRGWMMVRKPQSVFKDMIAISTRGVANYHNYLRDVGLCGLSLYADCPLVGTFYSVLSRQGSERLEGELKGGLAYWMKQGASDKLSVLPGNYSIDCLLSYCKAFSLEPTIVNEFEELVESDLMAAVRWLSLLC